MLFRSYSYYCHYYHYNYYCCCCCYCYYCYYYYYNNNYYYYDDDNNNNKNNDNNKDDDDHADDDADDDSDTNNHRFFGLELCSCVCLCDGSPDYGCVALARAVSPLHWGGCYRDAPSPGPRLAQGGVARAPTDSARSRGRPGVV